MRTTIFNDGRRRGSAPGNGWNRDKYTDTGFRLMFKAIAASKHLNNLTCSYLEALWIEQQGKCAYSGIDLELPTKTFKPPRHKQASVDRIDSSFGYIIGNVQFVSLTMNYAKNKTSDAEFRIALKELGFNPVPTQPNHLSNPMQTTDLTTHRFWTYGHRPFVMGGDVHYVLACDLECTGPHDLGGGYSGYLATAPNGKTFVAEDTTGAIVGDTLEAVRGDIASAEPEVMERQIAKATEDAKKAEVQDAATFWAAMRCTA